MDGRFSVHEDLGGVVSVLLSLKPQDVRARLPTMGARMGDRGQN